MDISLLKSNIKGIAIKIMPNISNGFESLLNNSNKYLSALSELSREAKNILTNSMIFKVFSFFSKKYNLDSLKEYFFSESI